MNNYTWSYSSLSLFKQYPHRYYRLKVVKDIKEGLVIEHLMGAGQGNTLGGDFSGNVLLGFKIEKGEITGRVKDTMVSGNIYQLLRGITAIGSDCKWVGGSLCIPSLYFSDISVASR